MTNELDWKEVVVKEALFRLTFPSEPKQSQKDLETAAGKLTVHSYLVDEGMITFSASWLEFPQAYIRKRSSVAILDGAKEAFFKKFKGKFLAEKIVQMGAAPGRDSTYQTEDNVCLRLKMYLRGPKLIQVLVMSEPEYIDSEDAKRFLDSLKWD